VSGTGTTNANADVIVGQILLGNPSQFGLEGCGEEQVVVIGVFIGI
jgi:hypothetical protein